MSKFRIACHVCTWGALTREHREPVFRQIVDAGYEGVEGLFCESSEDLVETVSSARTYGLHVVMVHARTPHQIIRYNAVLGNHACEIWEGPIEDLGPPDISHEERFAIAAKFFEPLIAEAKRHGMKLYHHIHLGQLVVTHSHIDLLIRHIPDMGILLDTGHLLAGGGDPLRLIREHGKRISHVHLKDFYRGSGWDFEHNRDFTKSYFVPLGEGNTGLDVGEILKALEEISYDGWVTCELDPMPAVMSRGLPVSELIRRNRNYLRSLGY